MIRYPHMTPNQSHSPNSTCNVSKWMFFVLYNMYQNNRFPSTKTIVFHQIADVSSVSTVYSFYCISRCHTGGQHHRPTHGIRASALQATSVALSPGEPSHVSPLTFLSLKRAVVPRDNIYWWKKLHDQLHRISVTTVVSMLLRTGTHGRLPDHRHTRLDIAKTNHPNKSPTLAFSKMPPHHPLYGFCNNYTRRMSIRGIKEDITKAPYQQCRRLTFFSTINVPNGMQSGMYVNVCVRG